MNDSQSRFIFSLCCTALVVTSMTFAIRAGILGQLGTEFGLHESELGWVNAMAFLGFPIATMTGGAIYNRIGAKRLIGLAFISHLAGLILTISAHGFWGLLISTFLVGFANGAIEAGCNPLIAEMYPKNATTMLNRFHVWFPGGIVIGALASNAMTAMGSPWQWQVGLILVPTFMYGAMLLKSEFPATEQARPSTGSNFKNLFSPLYLFLVVCMTLTATTELGTQQWIERILSASGASPMLTLALITGVMALGRYFAGPVVHQFSTTGVLLGSAMFTCIGIYMMSEVQGPMIYVAAVFFAMGVTYFWPTMLGCAAEYAPGTGALGMSLLGGAGMFAVSMWNPVIGGWIESAHRQAQASKLSAADIEVIAGHAVLNQLLIFPSVLVLAFAGLHVYMKRRASQQKG